MATQAIEHEQRGAIVPLHNGVEYRQSTDAAGLCREIVKQTAKSIQGRRYVTVEGWQAIAVAHGCAASAMDVERVTDEGMSGFRCTGTVRRMSDGAEIARGEGFLGDDEGTWSKRPVYARRAMVQTRAISRACRSAFAHVVVMIDAGLSTTPAEEVPDAGFDDAPVQQTVDNAPAPKAKREALAGPYTSKTALWQAVKLYDREVRSCGDMDSLEAFLAMDESKALVTQLERDAPQLLHGGEGLPDEYEPLLALLSRRRTELNAPTYLNAG